MCLKGSEKCLPSYDCASSKLCYNVCRCLRVSYWLRNFWLASSRTIGFLSLSPILSWWKMKVYRFIFEQGLLDGFHDVNHGSWISQTDVDGLSVPLFVCRKSCISATRLFHRDKSLPDCLGRTRDSVMGTKCNANEGDPKPVAKPMVILSSYFEKGIWAACAVLKRVASHFSWASKNSWDVESFLGSLNIVDFRFWPPPFVCCSKYELQKVLSSGCSRYQWFCPHLVEYQKNNSLRIFLTLDETLVSSAPNTLSARYIRSLVYTHLQGHF